MTEIKMASIPETFTVTTGGEEERYIRERREAFFADVRQSLGLGAVRCDMLFRYVMYQQHHQPDHPTDDRLHLLTYLGMQPLASVLDWRNDFNNHVVEFATYPLIDTTKKSIIEFARDSARLEQLANRQP